MPRGLSGGSYIFNIRNSPGVEILRMRTFDVDYVTQNVSYVQLLATPCVVLPLLHNLRQTSSERFVKRAIVSDFLWREDGIAIGIATPNLDWVVQGIKTQRGTTGLVTR